MYKMYSAVNIITLSDIKHTDGFNPVIINFGIGMHNKTLARALMIKAFSEYLGMVISEEYAETVVSNYDVNDPDYVEGVIKDIKRMFHSSSKNNYRCVSFV